MSSLDRIPELAVALDGLVPLDESSRADWDDVVARVGRRRSLWLGRSQPSRRLRLAIVVALLFLLLTGAATATYLLLRGNGSISLGGGIGKLLAVNPNGPGVRAIASCPTLDPGCSFSEPAWSPDGRRIAFARGGGDERRMFVYVAAADGGGTQRLASCGGCGEQYGGTLGWSPDGKWIAFTRDGPRGSWSLWVVPAAGGEPRRLTDCPVGCADFQPAWSPDGRVIAFERWGHTSGLFTIHADGSNLTRIASAQGEPDWSPDGHRIAFDRTNDSIAVAHADGSHVHVLFAGARGTGPGAPSWSPDGRKLVFFKTPGRPHYRAEVWTMHADGSRKKRLYHSGCCVGIWAPPIWSPDGHLIAFSTNSAGGTFVINADGTGLRRISPSTFFSLSWQPLPKGERP